MTVDAVVARELLSLREELSDAQRARAAVAPDSSGSAASAAEPTKETPDEREIMDQLRELADEVTGFFTEAERSISAHPAQSVIGALLVGIIIGRLLPRR